MSFRKKTLRFRPTPWHSVRVSVVIDIHRNRTFNAFGGRTYAEAIPATSDPRDPVAIT